MPTVNKVAYDHASLELDLSVAGGKSFGLITGFDGIEYGDKIDRSKQYGSARYPEDATDGVIDSDGSLDLLRWQYQSLLAQLAAAGIGFYLFEGTGSVTYYNRKEPVHVDTITGLQFADRKHSSKQGPDKLTVPISLFIKGKIFVDGVGPLGEKLNG